MPNLFCSSTSPAVAEIVVPLVGSTGWCNIQRLALFVFRARQDVVLDSAKGEFESVFVSCSVVAGGFKRSPAQAVREPVLVSITSFRTEVVICEFDLRTHRFRRQVLAGGVYTQSALDAGAVSQIQCRIHEAFPRVGLVIENINTVLYDYTADELEIELGITQILRAEIECAARENAWCEREWDGESRVGIEQGICATAMSERLSNNRVLAQLDHLAVRYGQMHSCQIGGTLPDEEAIFIAQETGQCSARAPSRVGIVEWDVECCIVCSAAHVDSVRYSHIR